MLAVSQVNQYYGESHTLWDMDLKVAAGSCTCLMGRNGVGKTTLLKTIMGLLPTRTGKITFGDHALTAASSDARARLGIGYVPQGREIFGQLTVAENLRAGTGTRADRDADEQDAILDLFPALRSMLQRRGGDLSGGQQQQLAIGRALALRPQLLILDEPTEGIQPNIVTQIGDVLTALNRERGLTLLLVEQKLSFARRVADRFVIMDRGRAMLSGMMNQLTPAVASKYLTV